MGDFYALPGETGKIVEAHRNDFNSTNVKSVLSSKGGYSNYVKSLGGIFGKYFNFSGKVKTKAELIEIMQYVWGLYDIWGVDYSNGCNWTYDENKYGGKNPFYSSVNPSERFSMNYAVPAFKNGNDLPGIDKQLSNPDKYYAVTNCGQGVCQVLKKAGLIGENERGPDSYMAYFKEKGYGYRLIKNAKDLKTGDIMLFYHGSIPGRASKTTVSNWESNMFHTAIIGEVEGDYIWMYDSGHAYTQSGLCHNRRRFGDNNVYQWADDWLGVRFDMIDKLADVKPKDGWCKVGGYWRYSINGVYQKGWKYLKWSKGENWFYFNSSGNMVTGWQFLKWAGGKKQNWFYFDDISGVMLTGLHKLKWSGGKKTDIFYFDPKTGAMATGSVTLKAVFDKASGALKV